MQSKLFIRKTASCPDCGHKNRVLFYVPDMLSVRNCDHCGQVVKFDQPPVLTKPRRPPGHQLPLCRD